MSPTINVATVNIKDNTVHFERYDGPLLDDLHKCQANLIIHCYQLGHLDG